MADKTQDTDILTDALRVVGAESGQEGLPTPAEMEALEEGQEAAAQEGATEAATEEGKSTATTTEALKGIDIDVLQEKVEKNQELSEDEQAALAVIQSEADKPEKSYTIAGKTYSFAEMESKFRQETDNEQTEFTPAGLEKTVDTFARSQNREAAHVATAERQKVLARETKEIEAERQGVAVEKARMETQRLSLERDRNRIEKVKAKLEAKANSPVTEEQTVNPETGIIDTRKFLEYQAKLNAQEELASIAEEEDKIAREESQISAQIAYASLKSTQLAHPQYRTSEDLLVVAQKIVRKESISAEDKAKFLALRSMYQEADAAQLEIEDVYDSRRLHGQVLPDVAQTTAGTRPGLKQLNKERTLAQQAEAIRRFKERVAKNPKLAESIGGGQRGKENRRPAQVLNAEERAVRADKGDPVARDWWKAPKH